MTPTKQYPNQRYDAQKADYDVHIRTGMSIAKIPSKKVTMKHTQVITVQDDTGAVATGFIMGSPAFIAQAIAGRNISGIQDNGVVDANSLSDRLSVDIMAQMISNGVDVKTLKLSASTAANLTGLSIDIGTRNPDGTISVDQINLDDYQSEYANRAGILTVPVDIRLNSNTILYIPYSLAVGETLSVYAELANADVFTK